MSIVGFQQLWLTGSRIYFRPDPIGGVAQPVHDLGVVDPASPAFDIQKAELYDKECGRLVLIQEGGTQIDESYDITCYNLDPGTLSLFYGSGKPETYTRTQDDFEATQTIVRKGYLHKLVDSSGNRIHNIAGATIFTGTSPTEVNITDIDVDNGSGQAELTVSNVTGIAQGEKVYVGSDGITALGGSSLTTELGKVGQWTVAGVAGNVVTLTETMPGVDRTGVVFKLFHSPGTTQYVEGTDYEISDASKGLLKILSGGSISDGASVKILYSENAVTQERRINPQSAGGVLEGDCLIFWCREDGDEQSVRRCRASISASGSNIQAEEYSSVTLSFKVLRDISNATSPAGDFIYFKGSLPSVA